MDVLTDVETAAFIQFSQLTNINAIWKQETNATVNPSLTHSSTSVEDGNTQKRTFSFPEFLKIQSSCASFNEAFATDILYDQIISGFTKSC